LVLPRENPVVRADIEKLGTVFINLLNNAVRFTPDEGEITVRLKTGESEVLVEVQDTGNGIPVCELENIFMEFYQVEDHLTRRHSGLGMGLSIARELVKLHRGKIWAESPGPGRGSIFKVLLPLENGPATEGVYAPFSRAQLSNVSSTISR
jgi:signal transduction histidine kinase